MRPRRPAATPPSECGPADNPSMPEPVNATGADAFVTRNESRSV
jgi:hypothetical protein